jgi:signal transduction histidine kinase
MIKFFNLASDKKKMPTLNRIFVLNSILVFAISLFLFNFLGFFITKDIEFQHSKENLEQYILFIKNDFNSQKVQDLEQLNNLLKKLKNNLNLEINLIRTTNKINLQKITDSNIYKSRYETHKNKIYIYENFVIADEVYIYSFIQTKNLKNEFFVSIWGKIMIVFISLISLGMYQMYSVNRRIKQEITKIDIYLESIQNKNYSQTVELNFSLESYKIGKKLQKVINKLQKRDKQKQKYLARLKFMNKQNESLLNAISHELKNPIASIMGYSDILQKELSENSNVLDIQKKFITKIYNNSKKIDNMLNRLRFAVQLENNKFSLELDNFEISSLILEILSDLKNEYQNRNIKLIFSEKCHLFADKTLINLVIVNLIENGLKYSENELIIKIENNILSVQDFGQGIEKEKITKITQKFYRIDSNHSQQSMGLGLAIVSYILRLHNLELKIDSIIEKGSIFSINLSPILKLCNIKQNLN